MVTAAIPVRGALWVAGAARIDCTDTSASLTALEFMTESTDNTDILLAGSIRKSVKSRGRDCTEEPGSAVAITALDNPVAGDLSYLFKDHHSAGSEQSVAGVFAKSIVYWRA